MSRPIRNLATLRQLLVLTEDMIEAARVGDWDEVSSLDQQRLHLLKGQDETVDSDGSSQRRLSQLIQEADTRLLANISASREQMARAGAQQRSRSTAVRGYRDAQALQHADQ